MCTGLILKCQDGNVIFARTVEFAMTIKYNKFNTESIIGSYCVFPNSEKNFVLDGLNRSGLMVGAFLFSCKEEEYNTYSMTNKINIQTGDLTYYILNNYESVEDVLRDLNNFNVTLSEVGGTKFSLHWLLTDKSGQIFVLEVSNGELKAYKNDLGVITNYPDFPTMISFHNKYNLSAKTAINSCYMGTGAGDPFDQKNLNPNAPIPGLPGDITSPSRFVRVSFFRNKTPMPENKNSGIKSAFSIMRNFDIPLGSVITNENNQLEITDYTVVYSVNDFESYYAPYGNTWDSKISKWVLVDKMNYLNYPPTN